MKKTFKPSEKQFTSKPSEKLSKSLFFTFLKQNGAYDSFMRNSYNPGDAYDIVDLDRLSPDFYVAGAFFWPSTPEGLDYWKLIDYKWNLVVDLFNL